MIWRSESECSAPPSVPPGVIHIRVKFDAGCQAVGQPPDELGGIGLAVEEEERVSGGPLQSGGFQSRTSGRPADVLQRAVADLRDRATYRGTNSGLDNSVVGQPAALRAWVTPVVLDSGVDAEQRLVVIGHRPVQVFHNEA